MIRKDWYFNDQILQAAVTLDKKLNYHPFFFNFNSSFFLSIFYFNIPVGRTIPTIPIY